MMAKPDRYPLKNDVRRILLRSGSASARELCEALGTSQPTISRALANLQGQLLKHGRARATRYSLRRDLPGIAAPVPVYEVARGPGSKPRHVANLHPVEPAGFYVEGLTDDMPSGLTDDLPWF